eukprot:139449-Prorocentrum_minimum.AAC.1
MPPPPPEGGGNSWNSQRGPRKFLPSFGATTAGVPSSELPTRFHPGISAVFNTCTGTGITVEF